jgi:hypothetical protein
VPLGLLAGVDVGAVLEFPRYRASPVRCRGSITGLPRMSPPPSIDKVGTPPSGADDRKVPVQHIDELRQAVDARPTQKRAD